MCNVIGKETIRIGDFRITSLSDENSYGRVYIENLEVPGEGGEFKEVDLEAVIAKFYVDNL